MKYLPPEELKKNKQLFLDAHAEEGDYAIHAEGLTTDLVRRFVPSTDAPILDCGVGSGFFLKKLHDAGYRNLYGVDIDDYRSHADEKSGMLKKFAAIDLCFDKFPWQDNFFDAVTAWETLEHLENAYHMIREVNRVLKPGGLFMLSMPNPINLISRLIFLKNGELPHWSAEDNHIAVFTPGIFKKAFRNFTVVEQGYHKGCFPYRFLARIPLPANKWFGETAWWVLRKR